MNLGQSVLNSSGDIPKSKNVLPYSRHHVLLSSNLEIMFPEDRNHVQSLENKNHNASEKEKNIICCISVTTFHGIRASGAASFCRNFF